MSKTNLSTITWLHGACTKRFSHDELAVILDVYYVQLRSKIHDTFIYVQTGFSFCKQLRTSVRKLRKFVQNSAALGVI